MVSDGVDKAVLEELKGILQVYLTLLEALEDCQYNEEAAGSDELSLVLAAARSDFMTALAREGNLSGVEHL